MQLFLIISTVPSNCNNKFWNNIFYTYICHSIRNDGLYLVSEHVFLWENMCMVKLSTMTVDPWESNETCYDYSTLEESMWHFISFEILHNTKGLFLVWPLGGLFLEFQLGLVEFLLYLLVLIFFLQSQLLSHLSILS